MSAPSATGSSSLVSSVAEAVVSVVTGISACVSEEVSSVVTVLSSVTVVAASSD